MSSTAYSAKAAAAIYRTDTKRRRASAVLLTVDLQIPTYSAKKGE
jgi:hypothetical protein